MPLVALYMIVLLVPIRSVLFESFQSRQGSINQMGGAHNVDTGLNYTSIQEAIDADETLNGQTILVDDGTYYEHVVVNKSLTVIGESDNTIVDGNASGPMFIINAENVSLINFTAANAGFTWPSQSDNFSQDPWAVLLNQTVNCLVKNVKIWGSSDGVVLVDSNNNKISGCEFFGSESFPFDQRFGGGMVLITSNGNTIGNNSVTGAFTGIALAGNWSNENVLAGNSISFCFGNAFDIVGSYNNITSNRLWNNSLGLVLDMSSCNLISCNDISNSTAYGVVLAKYSSNNTIWENTIKSNEWSVSAAPNSGDNNVFYHNNFLGNTYPPLMPSGVDVAWDDGYPSGGNYWSCYNGTDVLSGNCQNESNSDGIGDEAYIFGVSYSQADRYPLMGMFSDFNATSQIHVQTVCNSTISDFQFNGTAISFNTAGENGTTGFCRICIPTALINATYTVFVNKTEVPYTLLPESNNTQDYLYFTYHNSMQEVIITPELPSALFLSTLVIATVLSLMIGRKSMTSSKKRPKRLTRM
jgi:parallel beta-helix repeat protein